MRLEIIQHAIAQCAVEGADADTVAAATARVLRLLFAELDPLVGTQAVRALYGRSLYLTRSSFEWVSPAAVEAGGDVLANLQRQLASRDAADTRRAGTTVLQTFADLLISLIGEPLTYRMLRSAWSIPAGGEPSQENAP